MLRKWFVPWQASLAALALLCFTAMSAEAASPRACSTTYDAAAKVAVLSLLKARYGTAYKSFDVDIPDGVLTFPVDPNYDIVTAADGSTIRVDPRKLYWRGFARKRGVTGAPHIIAIAFEKCSNSKIIGYKVFSEN